MSPRGVVFALFFGFAATFAAFLGWIAFGHIPAGWWNSTEFEAVEWRNASDYEGASWPPRLCMVGDLMNSELLDGMSESDVVKLLGPPHKPGHPGGARECDIHYWLGPEPQFMSWDDRWLFIEFDDQDTVESYWLYTD